MSVRNCQELGVNLQKICSRLLANDNLVKLLYYTDLDPLSQKNLTNEEKAGLLNDLIGIVPKSDMREDSRSTLRVWIPKVVKIPGNNEFRCVMVVIDNRVPLTHWIIKDSNLRPFAIMGEIQSSLDGKTVNGLGKIQGGDFELSTVTDEMSIYRQTFTITEYD